MRFFIVLFISLATFTAQAQQFPKRQVAITIDDLPSQEVSSTSEALLAKRNKKIVRALRGTHTMGFANEDKLYKDGTLLPSRVALLEAWPKNGLPLGNHTSTHKSMHAIPIEQYEQTILDGEKTLRPLLARHQQQLEWFRHPYLHAGRIDADRERLDAFLRQHNYKVAPVTVDNGEWIYARAYLKLVNEGKHAEAEQLVAEYIDYIDAKFAFFERCSLGLFGREIPQILLIHANALNADALPRLLKRIQQRDYEFIPLEQAVADTAYQHPDAFRGAGGVSWLHRWALTQKRPKEFYRGEPEVPKHVLDLAGVDGE